MAWFIMEFVVVGALISGFMATHSPAVAIVSAAPVIAAMVWLRSMQVDEATLWLVGGVPLLASMLGLVLGQYARHRATAREKTAASPAEAGRPAPSQVALDARYLDRSVQFRGGTLGFAAVKAGDIGDHGIEMGRRRVALSAAIAAAGSVLDH